MHRNSGYAFILTGVLLNATAQLLLKAGTDAVGRFQFVAANTVRTAHPRWCLFGTFCYLVSLVVWIIGLSCVEVSVPYQMLSRGYIVNAVGAWYPFDESTGIVAGVVLITRS